MMKTPEITVAIPTYKREEVLVNTIRDVLENQTIKNLELIVVDQSLAHNKNTTRFIESIKDKRFRYFKTSPPSVTAARNFALKKAKTPFIVFLDDDVVLNKDLVEVYLKTFASHAEISAIAGRVNQDGFPIKRDVLKFDEFTISHGVFSATKSSYTNAFPGGNCALRVKEVLAIGGFDTRFKNNAFREESDMSLRMSKLGYRILYEPKAALLHLSAPYGGNRVKKHIYDNYGFYKNELYFTLKHVEHKKIIEALRRKYNEYCLTTRGLRAWIRRIYFLSAIMAALYRIFFVKTYESVELK